MLIKLKKKEEKNFKKEVIKEALNEKIIKKTNFKAFISLSLFTFLSKRAVIDYNSFEELIINEIADRIFWRFINKADIQQLKTVYKE